MEIDSSTIFYLQWTIVFVVIAGLCVALYFSFFDSKRKKEEDALLVEKLSQQGKQKNSRPNYDALDENFGRKNPDKMSGITDRLIYVF